MQIVYHLGAHFTDEDRLLRCLMANREALAEEGVVVPNPAVYRNLLREVAVRLKGKPASPEQQQALMTQILGAGQNADTVERVIFSWESFLALPPWVLKDTLYPAAGERALAYNNIFPGLEHEFFMAIRNPATFLPLLYPRSKSESYQAFMGEASPINLKWSAVVARILAALPHADITLWCDEDTPLIWPEVLRAVSGAGADQPLAGEGDLLEMLMSGEGLTRMQAYMQTRPPTSVAQRRKIVSAFLDKFALPERIGLPVDLPGWTQNLVDDLTNAYDGDVAQIIASGRVRFLLP